MADCTPKKRIPELECIPPISIDRLPTAISSSLDTTDLSDIYKFTEDDLNILWNAAVTTVTGDAVEVTEDCLVGGDTREDSELLISFYDDAVRLSAGRGWVGELPCSQIPEETTPVTFHGPVSFSNRRSPSFSMPTFVPRAGGGKSQETTDGACEPQVTKIYVKNTSSTILREGRAVDILDSLPEEDTEALSATHFTGTRTWVVALSDIEPGEYGCCASLGVVKVYLTTDSPTTGSCVYPTQYDGLFSRGDTGKTILTNTLDGGCLVILGSAGDNAQLQSLPFTVTNITAEADKPKVLVHWPGEDIAGVDKGVTYPSMEINIPTSSEEVWIIGVSGYFYASTTRFNTNVVPCLEVAKVDVKTMRITNYAHPQSSGYYNPWDATSATSINNVDIRMSNDKLSIESLNIDINYLLNNQPLIFKSVTIPIAAEGPTSVWLCIDKITRPNDEPPVATYVVGDTEPSDKEWVVKILHTTGVGGDYVFHPTTNANLFTFTILPLNAS